MFAVLRLVFQQTKLRAKPNCVRARQGDNILVREALPEESCFCAHAAHGGFGNSEALGRKMSRRC